MSWDWVLGLYVVGTLFTAIVLYLSIHLGLRWQRELPKIPIHESLQVLEQRAQESRLEFEELQERLFEARATIEQAEQSKRWLVENAEDVRDLQLKADQLREVREKHAVALEALDKALANVRELETRHAILAQQLKGQEDILQRLEDLRREEVELKTRLATAKAEQGDLAQSVGRARQQEQELRDILNDLHKSKHELLESHARLQAEVAQMEDERDHLRSQIEKLTQERLNVAPPEAATLEQRTAALWRPPVLQPEDIPTCLDRDATEEDTLERAINRIRNAGLSFAERTLYAFHTAVKTSRESPLLVLAGISGTGKSALPRRYAEAMGIHFLNVAVQPGWDSPMDLLGFYNHLEGRFKPTELMRALIQVDRFGREPERWPESSQERTDLSERMLLVLLDEMNLARIEYYFSEFLSRLEIRRDIPDLSSERQRRPSEIRLEIGRSQDGETQTVPLSVAENVLFVGTMNEDESTLSLSEKVVDRSNVIRFGRPEALQSCDSLTSCSSDEFLRFETWQRWRAESQPFDDHDRNRVERWIQASNRLLDHVGRPFGHRGARAIREYVRNYPSFVPDRTANAMADQVEMRVLPKLRGIDPQEESGRIALDELLLLVEELQDDALTSAIRQQRNRSESHLFLWQGLDRMPRIKEPGDL